MLLFYPEALVVSFVVCVYVKVTGQHVFETSMWDAGIGHSSCEEEHDQGNDARHNVSQGLPSGSQKRSPVSRAT